MQVSFRELDGSALARHMVGSLGRDEVQVWVTTTPAHEASVMALAGQLSPEERERAGRFRVREPRCQFVFGRALLRQLLGASLKADPATLVFGYQPRGKPFLVQSGLTSDLRFNLAHSGRMVAIALAWGRDVGVDVEFMRCLEDWPLLAERIFSSRELCELHSLPKPQQREAFFNGWTRKEAWLKATGKGLTDALPAIEVTLAPGTDPELIGLPNGPEAAGHWAIRAIPLPVDYVGAVVFKQSSSVPA